MILIQYAISPEIRIRVLRKIRDSHQKDPHGTVRIIDANIRVSEGILHARAEGPAEQVLSGFSLSLGKIVTSPQEEHVLIGILQPDFVFIVGEVVATGTPRTGERYLRR